MVDPTIVDLSGGPIAAAGSNPYKALIEACNNDPVQTGLLLLGLIEAHPANPDEQPQNTQLAFTSNAAVQSQIHSRYNLHRQTRTAQQKALLLSPIFPGPSVDPILRSLILDQHASDPRNNLVFWAHPPQRIRSLIASIQRSLREVIRSEDLLWLMPQQNLHTTVLEIAHSETGAEGEARVRALSQRLEGVLERILAYPLRLWEGEEGGDGSTRTARLARPMIMYDAAALAVSFLPVVPSVRRPDKAGVESRQLGDAELERPEQYTYHHLRRDLWEITNTKVPVASRYVVPSAHLTIGRFVGEGIDEELMRKFVERIEELNLSLERQTTDGESDFGEWVVGEERPMRLQAGSCWYGEGGWTVQEGCPVFP